MPFANQGPKLREDHRIFSCLELGCCFCCAGLISVLEYFQSCCRKFLGIDDHYCPVDN